MATPIIAGATYRERASGKLVLVTSNKTSAVYFYEKRRGRRPEERTAVPPTSFRRRFALVDR
jgi:hypothetical protein